MKITNRLLSLGLAVLFLASCSSGEDAAPEVTFTAMTTNKTDVFIDQPITITVDGTGYTDVNLTSSNSKIKITKLSTTTYEVSSTAPTSAVVYAELKNNSSTKTKSVDVNFASHGILNFKTAEGITINVDTSDKILRLLGEAEVKTDLAGTTPVENWEYPSKGISFIVIKSSKLVTVAKVNTSNFYALQTDGITKVYYTKYPYEIGNEWKLDLATATMTQVIAKYGTDYTKSSSTTTTLRNYKYTIDSQKAYFYFYSDSEDDYTGKTIRSLVID
ncbi:hypothetical protein [Flavobacterium algicola]|uniref:hypothetical protein n=1 Tax=Flavobacterium algicola TaxID=556529 RepID=UPI001EFC77C4|nr:hypothetical protein [Flavobacterium algicola]MCG9793485.1 hypothetical protein [Flavobacterium algicola]